LYGEYITHYRTFNEDECFDICDVETKCAAACFTNSDTCRFFRFGFEGQAGQTSATAYIKPEVSR
jgi:hypothetical protein